MAIRPAAYDASNGGEGTGEQGTRGPEDQRTREPEDQGTPHPQRLATPRLYRLLSVSAISRFRIQVQPRLQIGWSKCHFLGEPQAMHISNWDAIPVDWDTAKI